VEWIEVAQAANLVRMLLHARVPHVTRHCSTVLVVSSYVFLHETLLPDIKLCFLIM
jgi:hypothetical protein